MNPAYQNLADRARAAHPADFVLTRCFELRRSYQPWIEDRTKTRDIVNGGRAGVVALFGANTKFDGVDLPAANFIDTGLERTGQKLGELPDLKVDPPLGQEGPRRRYDADMLAQIVGCYDDLQALNLQMPQQARWLVGYGYCVWVITTHQDPVSGHWYPVARYRNTYDAYPSAWDADGDPEEMCVTRLVSVRKLSERYPGFARDWAEKVASASSTVIGQYGSSVRDGVPLDAVTVHEYYDITGCYYICEETATLLDFWPNPLDVPPFVVSRRFTFDALGGAFRHVIGLQAMIARLNILAFIAAEDSTLRALNIVGDMSRTTYRKGRGQVNYFPPGTQIDKEPVETNLFQAWSQIDRLERSLRIGSNYPQMVDAESPLSFATGQGLEKLQGGFGSNIREYQTILTAGLQKIDALRLAWDEALYSGMRKPLYAMVEGRMKVGTYDPARIKGWYRTRRVYGMMADWDEPQKIVGGLQLLSAKVIDRQTLQENLNGLDQISRINERVTRDDAQGFMLNSLAAQAQQGDPRAMLTLVEIYQRPRDIEQILAQHFTPQEPAETPEVEQFLGQQAPPQQGPPPDVTTVLSRLETGGEVGGGAQTVARV